MTSTLNRPLVVHDSEVVCGRGHALRVITNGPLFYAAMPGGTDVAAAVRDAATLRVVCGQALADGEPCDIEVEVDITSEDWTGDPVACDLLGRLGEPVQR